MIAATATLALAGATQIVKKVIDDLYAKAKDEATRRIGKARSSVNEASVAKSLASVTKVKTLWNVTKEVSLYQFYFPSYVQFEGLARKAIKSIDGFGKLQNFVIQGTAGQGKSIFLRYLCGQELVENSSSGRVPIFVELRRLRSDFSIDALILDALKKYKLPSTSDAWEHLANSGKFVLLMDAFDEIDPNLVSKAISDIEALCDLFDDRLQIIITARPDAEIQKSAKFRVCRLAPLEPSDHHAFLKKICAESGQADSLMKVINASSSDIRGLLTTPLMMTLLVILYKSLQTVPDTIPKFYEELFDVLFYRHDQSKPGFRRKRYTALDDSKLKALFAAFCFYVRLRGLGVMSSAQFQEVLSQAVQAGHEQVDPDKFRDELTKTACLMQQDGFEISFIHKSVAQYYAASFVSKSSDGFARAFYNLAAKHERDWNLELKFLSQVDSYRFCKHYELPLINRIARNIEYSFSVYDPKAESNLCDVMFGLAIVTSPVQSSGQTASKKKNIVGWIAPHPSEEVLSQLVHPWVSHLHKNGLSNMEVDDLGMASKKPRTRGKNGFEESPLLASAYRDQILSLCPEVAKETLKVLQARHDAAQAIVVAEEAKTEMLAAFVRAA